MSSKLKAGTYWVGDLCYVMHDEWSEVCGTAFKDDSPVKSLKNGVQFSIQRTAWGDGAYADNEENYYTVDSGTLGCVQVNDIKDHPENHFHGGHVHNFDEDFEVTNANGLIGFGEKLFINTDEDADDIADEWEDDE